MMSGSSRAVGLVTRGALEARRRELGVVTFVVDPGRFFVHLTCEADRLAMLMQRLFDQLEPLRASAGRLTALVPGSLVAALFVDSLWYRAQVVAVDRVSQAATLYYIDYGNTEVQPLDGIRALPADLRSPPPLAIACALSGAKQAAAWTPEQTALFRKTFLTPNDDADPLKFTFVVVEPGDTNKVEIFDELRSNVGRRFLDQSAPRAVPPPLPNRFAAARPLAPTAPGGPLALRARRPSPVGCVLSDGSTLVLQAADPLVRFTPTPMEQLCGRRCQVVLSFVNSPTDLWVRLSGVEAASLAGVSATVSLTVVNERMQDYYARMPSAQLPVCVERGFPCAAQYHLDNQWYRAQVADNTVSLDDPVKVFFVDYGNTEAMERSCLRCLPADLISCTPPLALHARMAGISPPDGRDWPPAASELLDTMLETAQLVARFRQLAGGVIEVALSEAGGDNSDLSELLVRHGLAIATDAPQPSAKTVTPFVSESARGRPAVNVVAPLDDHQQCVGAPTSPPPMASAAAYKRRYKPLTLTGNQRLGTVLLIVGDGPQNMCMQAEMHTAELQKLDAAVRRVVRTPALAMTRPLESGTECVVQFDDDEWYRAEVVQDEGRAVHVRFVDFGNEASCVAERLRLLPDDAVQLHSTPRLALHCRLSGGVRSLGGLPYDALTKDRFEAIVNESTGTVVVVPDSEGVFEVELKRSDGSSVADVLITEGIAEVAPRQNLAAAVNETAAAAAADESLFKVACLPALTIPAVSGDFIDVTVCSVKAPDLVFVHLGNSKEVLRGIDQMIRACSFDGGHEKEKLINPRRGELCAWKRVDKATGREWWCRALITDRSSPKLLNLYLVDLGEHVTADVDSVRLLGEELRAMPAQAICLSVTGVNVERDGTRLLGNHAVAKLESALPTGDGFGATLLLESEDGGELNVVGCVSLEAVGGESVERNDSLSSIKLQRSALKSAFDSPSFAGDRVGDPWRS